MWGQLYLYKTKIISRLDVIQIQQKFFFVMKPANNEICEKESDFTLCVFCGKCFLSIPQEYKKHGVRGQ